MQIVLASQSPRRQAYFRELFGTEGFVCSPADIPEPFDRSLSVVANAEQLALAKAKHVQTRFPAGIIVASDTIVEVNGELLAKAETRTGAAAMLTKQLGHTTHVVSALAVLEPHREIVTHDVTEVTFRRLSDPGVHDALQRFLDSGEWVGKAGAYAIQNGAAPLIQSIRGDISVVIGLPVRKLREVFETQFGVVLPEVLDVVPAGIAALR